MKDNMLENKEQQERALLVALDTGEYDAEASLAELAELTRSAGAEPAAYLTQKRPAPDAATCFASNVPTASSASTDSCSLMPAQSLSPMTGAPIFSAIS